MRYLDVPYVQEIVTDPVEETLWQTDEDFQLEPDVRRKPWLWDATNGYAMPAPGGLVTPSVVPAALMGRAGLHPVYPPHYVPPLAAYMLDYPLNRLPVVIPAAGSAVFAFPRVPQGNRGVCRKIAAVVTAGLLTDTLFTTRINLSPVQPFPGVRGAIGTLEAPQDTQVILAAGDLFDLLVQSTGAGITVAVRLYGWWWSDATA